MKLDLGTIIADLISGRAKLRKLKATGSAGAGTNLDVNMFKCPPNTLRLLLDMTVLTTKTTATLLAVAQLDKDANYMRYLFYRSVGSEGISLPTDEASKDLLEVSIACPLIFTYGMQIKIVHNLTAAETIAHTYYINYIEWTPVDTQQK